MITEIKKQIVPTDSDLGPKTSQPRLLDLTVGWARYVEETESDFGDTVSSAALYDLYQDAAQISPHEGAMTDAAVKEFILNRIMPLVSGANSQ